MFSHFVTTGKKTSYMKFVKKIIPNGIKKYLRELLFTETKPSYLNFPRYTVLNVELLGKKITIPDNRSYYFMHKEIFEEEIYRFETSKTNLFIIDAGANIGLATIYFKNKYNNAEILAFEPDKTIFNVLKNNIESYNFNKITLRNTGLWRENDELFFEEEGADAGRIIQRKMDLKSHITVEKLSPYITKDVDFLKIDIEGAETEVLRQIESKLSFVKRIFIEYHSFINEEQSLHEIFKILNDANFRIYVSSPGLSSNQPLFHINKYNGMDMQLNIHAFQIGI